MKKTLYQIFKLEKLFAYFRIKEIDSFNYRVNIYKIQKTHIPIQL